MKKKTPAVIKDGLTGVGMGAAIIVPGISAGTIALILGSFKKLTEAAGNLFTKNFWKNLLILLPFGIGAVLAIAGLYFPFHFAFKYCMLAIVALFAGLIAGSLPGIYDQIKNEKISAKLVGLFIIGLLISASIGVLSVVLNFGQTITSWFSSIPGFLYVVILLIGIIAASGIIVPGLSGSLILLVIGFYQPILNLLEFNNGLKDLALGFTFGVGIIIGFVLWGKLMNSVIEKHHTATIAVVLGFIVGSLFSIFFNSNMFSYIQNDIGTLDFILAPVLLVVGVVFGYLLVLFTRKHKPEEI